jgi:hypothetical protein
VEIHAWLKLSTLHHQYVRIRVFGTHRYGQAERLRSFEVEEQQEMRRLQNRQCGWICATKNSPGVDASLSVSIGDI